jgi:hypothetical protein
MAKKTWAELQVGFSHFHNLFHPSFPLSSISGCAILASVDSDLTTGIIVYLTGEGSFISKLAGLARNNPYFPLFINKLPQTERYGLTPGHAKYCRHRRIYFPSTINTLCRRSSRLRLTPDLNFSQLLRTTTCHFRLRVLPLLEGKSPHREGNQIQNDTCYCLTGGILRLCNTEKRKHMGPATQFRAHA